LNYIVDNQLDLSTFDKRYKNDETGASAYNPSVLLKIILYGYSLGIVSSRRIAALCETNITFMALSADTRPHFTTIANFISTLEEEISSLFLSILLICSEEGLIGKHMFAIDGCKLSSNASKEWSGTRANFMKEKIDRWLEENKDKTGSNGKPIQSNITDNESAKMVSSKGVIQGYNGIAMVDDKNQVVVNAEAFGSGSEHKYLISMVDGAKENFKTIGTDDNVFEKTILTADSGNHSEENMKELFKRDIEAYIADNRFRKRDPDFASADRHKKKPTNRTKTTRGKNYFQPSDFTYDAEKNKLICPARCELYVENSTFKSTNGLKGIVYRGKKTDCRVCKIREKCLRNPNTEARQVAVFTNKMYGASGVFTQKMIEQFDSPMGRHIYSRRMGTVEPVFANIRNALKLDRFTLRGKKKVNIQ
jgi:transposase